jgi:hypothetical protein
MMGLHPPDELAKLLETQRSLVETYANSPSRHAIFSVLDEE